MDVVVVNSNGQVTLPAKERRKYGLRSGARVRVVEMKDGLLLQKARVVKESVFEKMARIADAKGITKEDIVRVCREVGKELHEEEFGKD